MNWDIDDLYDDDLSCLTDLLYITNWDIDDLYDGLRNFRLFLRLFL